MFSAIRPRGCKDTGWTVTEESEEISLSLRWVCFRSLAVISTVRVRGVTNLLWVCSHKSVCMCVWDTEREIIQTLTLKWSAADCNHFYFLSFLFFRPSLASPLESMVSTRVCVFSPIIHGAVVCACVYVVVFSITHLFPVSLCLPKEWAMWSRSNTRGCSQRTAMDYDWQIKID